MLILKYAAVFPKQTHMVLSMFDISITVYFRYNKTVILARENNILWDIFIFNHRKCG